jgi:hypothetical protein
MRYSYPTINDAVTSSHSPYVVTDDGNKLITNMLRSAVLASSSTERCQWMDVFNVVRK